MPTRILWVYGEWQGEYDILKTKFPQIEFHRSITEGLYETIQASERNLVIVDDHMMEQGGSDRLSNMFTKGAHHRNLTVVFIIQNLFHQGKSMRSISLNSHYMVLFKNPRDRGQIRTLAQQMFPEKPAFLVRAFTDATEEQFGYLLLDLHPTTQDRLRVRAKVFKDELNRVYEPPNGAYKKAIAARERN